MVIKITVSKEELDELNMNTDELEIDIIERLDSSCPDLPDYNVFIEIYG